ncbi:MAG: hypothetical protein ACYDAE_02690 [Steroidobacteraceae bacterium]
MPRRIASVVSDAASAAHIGKFPIFACKTSHAAMLTAGIAGMVALHNIDPTAPSVPIEAKTGRTFRDAQM